MLLVLRGATQLACRLNVLDDSEREWMLRATRNADEVRNLFAKRRSARSTAHRLVRGPHCVETSADQWPDKKTSNRPGIASPEGGPHAEPGEPQEKFVSLDSGLSGRARKVQSAVYAWSPPQRIADVLKGKNASRPSYPLRALGLGRGDLAILYGSERCA